MKDLAKEFLMNELDIPKIHGEVDIRLKNPMTGHIVKQIKGENTFQGPVLAKGLRSLGTSSASYYGMNGASGQPAYEPWKDLVGGILLFRNSLSNAQYMPKGNKMQANGSLGVVNNSNPTELGSWNENESSSSAQAITMVYDWTTSQANGAGGISSVALTSQTGGYIGYGNPSETSASTIRSLTDRVPYKSIQPINLLSGASFIHVNNKLYTITYDGNTKRVGIRKSGVPITRGSVFDWIPEDEIIDVSNLHYDWVYGGYAPNWYVSNGKMNVSRNSRYGETLQPLAKIYIWEYDPEEDEITEIEIINNTGEAINYVSAAIAHNMVFVAGNNKTHVFSLSDNSYIGYIDTDSAAIGYEWPGGLVAITSLNGTIRIYDADNRTCYPTNGTLRANVSSGLPYYDAETDTLNWYYTAGGQVFAINNPLYLATNYNLPSSVTKDATMTMQVRYTLQEA